MSTRLVATWKASIWAEVPEKCAIKPNNRGLEYGPISDRRSLDIAMDYSDLVLVYCDYQFFLGTPARMLRDQRALPTFERRISHMKGPKKSGGMICCPNAVT